MTALWGVFAWTMRPWYHFTQRIPRAGERAPLLSYGSLGEMTIHANRLRYQHDPQGWDAMLHPQHIQWLILNPPRALPSGRPGIAEVRVGGDCDDSAAWWAASLWKNREAIDVESVGIGIVSWVEDGQRKGHAVCLAELKDGRAFHIGNWFGNRPQFAGRSMSDALDAVVANPRFKAIMQVVGLDKDETLRFGAVEVLP